MASVIQTEGLSKRFRKTVAVDGLDLDVPEGSIYAFLGPNGAGKTTTIKMLVNILHPTSGRARVFGTDSARLGAGELQRLGYISENQSLPAWMKVRELLDYCRPMYPGWDRDFEQRLIDQFELPLDAKIRALSRGMKVKAALLSSLCYRPQLLVLDEPFSGLDPLVREDLVRGMLEISEQEKWSIFISSHDIDEVERLADWVGIVDAGKLRLSESIASLQRRFRAVEVISPAEPPPPDNPLATWLNVEREGATTRFIESAYDEGETERTTATHFPEGCTLNFTPLSLREIFLALARVYRLGRGGSL